MIIQQIENSQKNKERKKKKQIIYYSMQMLSY